jgi:hypothetical protein
MQAIEKGLVTAEGIELEALLEAGRAGGSLLPKS